MELIEGQNYLFFTKAYAAGPEVGLTGAQGNAVCTKNFLFFVPDERKEMGNQFVKSFTFGAVKEGMDTPTMLANLVRAPQMTVAGLEQSLIEFLTARAEAHYIFQISDLETFKNKTGFLGGTTLKKPGRSRIQLAMKGMKGAKKIINEFYGR